MIGSARSPRPHERDAALTLAWRSVVGTGFALPRDAGRRPALRFARRPALRGTRRDGNRPDGWGLRRRGPAGRCAGPHRGLEVGVPLRPAPSGPVGFARGAAFSQRGTHVGGAPRHRRCFALPRDAGRRPALQENWPALRCRAPPCLERYAPRREPSRRLGPAPAALRRFRVDWGDASSPYRLVRRLGGGALHPRRGRGRDSGPR